MVKAEVVPRGRAATAPGLAVHILAAVAAAGLLYASSSPAWQWRTAVPAGFVLAAATALWLIRWASWFAARRAGAATGGAGRAAVLPVGLVVLVALLAGAAPLRARFWLSEGAFRRAMVQSGPEGPRRVGLYDVTTSSGTMFFVETDSWSSSGGFVFTSGRPVESFQGSATVEDARFRHLFGDWYSFSASPRT